MQEEDYKGVQPLTAAVLVSGHFPASQNSFQLCFTAVCFKGLQASGTSGFIQCFLQQETGMRSSLMTYYKLSNILYARENLSNCRKIAVVLDQCAKLFLYNSEHLGNGSAHLSSRYLDFPM